jgi:hypothetical protein
VILTLAKARKKTGEVKEPEAFMASNEENDNMFFTFEPYEGTMELNLLVDMKGNRKEDDVECIYSVSLNTDDLKALRKWLDLMIKYAEYVDENGTADFDKLPELPDNAITYHLDTKKVEK